MDQVCGNLLLVSILPNAVKATTWNQFLWKIARNCCHSFEAPRWTGTVPHDYPMESKLFSHNRNFDAHSINAMSANLIQQPHCVERDKSKKKKKTLWMHLFGCLWSPATRWQLNHDADPEKNAERLSSHRQCAWKCCRWKKTERAACTQRSVARARSPEYSHLSFACSAAYCVLRAFPVRTCTEVIRLRAFAIHTYQPRTLISCLYFIRYRFLLWTSCRESCRYFHRSATVASDPAILLHTVTLCVQPIPFRAVSVKKIFSVSACRWRRWINARVNLRMQPTGASFYSPPAIDHRPVHLLSFIRSVWPERNV